MVIDAIFVIALWGELGPFAGCRLVGLMKW